MRIGLLKHRDDFPELSYSNDGQPRLKRWIIRSAEGLSGRQRYAALYAVWRAEVRSGSKRCFARLLELIDVDVRHAEAWPPERLPDTPLVMIANHPFGIGDGIAILSLAEKLGRPFRVMIAAELLKIPEMEPYALPVDFSDTKEALKNNLAIRHETVRLLKEGVTVVIFPAGGVATARKVLGQAEDLPWKMFVARLVQEARASVIPIHFAGQNGRLFHLVSKYMNLVESDHKLVRLRRQSVADIAPLPAGARVRAAVGQIHRGAYRAGVRLVDPAALARSQGAAGAPSGRGECAQAGSHARKALAGSAPQSPGGNPLGRLMSSQLIRLGDAADGRV